MAVLSKDDFVARIKSIVGESTDDATLSVLEDFTDTYNDLASKAANTGAEDWKSKYEKLDAEWRQKYKDRFFEGNTNPDPQPEQPDSAGEATEVEPQTFDDLFTT